MPETLEKKIQLKHPFPNPDGSGDMIPKDEIVNLAEPTMEHMVQLGMADWYDEDSAKRLDAQKNANYNAVAEQTAAIKKACDESFQTQMKQMGEAHDTKISGLMEQLSKNSQEDATCFKNIGEVIQVVYASCGVDFKNYKTIAKGWKTEKRFQEYRKITGQSEAVNADGGFFIESEMDNELVKRLVATAILYGDAKLRIISRDRSNGQVFNSRVDYNRVAGNHPGRAFRTGEGVQKSQHKWTIEQLEMKLLKLASLNVLTDELLEDVLGLAVEVSEWFVSDFGFKNDSEIFNGNGTTEMTGILDAGTAARLDIARELTGNVITLDDVANMFTSLFVGSLPNAKWYTNPKVFLQLLGFVVGNQPVFVPPSTGVSGTQFSSLFGIPLISIEQASGVGTLGDINLWDLSQYRVIQKGGIKIDTSNEVLFEEDETMLRFVMRNNGLPEWTQQMTGANGVDSFSPFVSLATFV